MDFRFTAEQELFRRTVADFVVSEVEPAIPEMEEKGEIPLPLFRRMGELGYFGLRYPEAYGGAGADMVTFCILCEELARGYMSVAAACAMQCLMGTDFIYRFGTDDHRERLLIPAIRGEKIGTIAMTEPGAGSDLGGITTTAVRDGDGYILNGTKAWITNATRADFLTVAAKTDPEAGFKGIDMFLVEKGTPGLTVGRKIEKMGVVASETSEVILRDVWVPAENLFGGQEGQGFAALRGILNDIRVMTAALSLGLARAAMEASLRYAQEREAFRRPIIKFQAIQHKLADMAVDIEASRLLTYYTAWLIDQGERCNKEAAATKLFASEAAIRAADEATRIFGAYGFAMELPAQRFFRDARFLLYGGGTSEILRNIIARELG